MTCLMIKRRACRAPSGRRWTMADDTPRKGRRRNKGMEHPEFIAHQWKPGQSGNPAGRPKKKTMEEVFVDLLAEEVGQTGVSKLETLAKVIFAQATTGKREKVMGILMDRLWPKPLKLVGDPDNPVIFETVEPDLSGLSDDELRQMAALRKKASGAA